MNNFQNGYLLKILLLRDLIKDWEEYPFNIPIIKNLTEINIHNKVCFFVGENGSGKSTLIEAIAEHCGFNTEGGSQNMHFANQPSDLNDVSNLADYLRLSWTKKLSSGYFLRAESLFNVASFLDELQKEDPTTLIPYGKKSLHQQSHGESFLALIRHRFSGKGLYLLDEPEAALSPQRQLSFLFLLNEIIQNNIESQFIIATHSPILLSFPNAQIISFDGESVGEIGYEETAAYKITKGFLDNPKSYLRHLFEK